MCKVIVYFMYIHLHLSKLKNFHCFICKFALIPFGIWIIKKELFYNIPAESTKTLTFPGHDVEINGRSNAIVELFASEASEGLWTQGIQVICGVSPHLVSTQFVRSDVSFCSVCGLWAGHRGKVRGSFSVGHGLLRQMTTYLTGSSPRAHEARCQQCWTQPMASLCRPWLRSMLRQPSASTGQCCGSQRQPWLLTLTFLKFVTYVQIWFIASHMFWYND